MKINIDKIEKATGYKVKRNFSCIGFDTAQRTGIAFIQTKKKVIQLDFIFLEFKDIKDTKKIYATMVKTFENLLRGEDKAIIEQVFVGFNRKGSVELARYGSFAIAECIKKDIDYDLVSAVSCRAKLKIDARKFGKGKAKKSVAYWLKEKLNIELHDEDISDAICLALLGILEGAV